MLELMREHGGGWLWPGFGAIGMSVYWIVVIAAILLLARATGRIRSRGQLDAAVLGQHKQHDLAA